MTPPKKRQTGRGGPGNRPKEYILERAEQLEALVNPLRRQVIGMLAAAGPLSVREIAARLQRSPESLHYHVRHLVKMDLVHACGTRPTSRRDELLYDVVADTAQTPADSDDPAAGWADAKEKIARADYGRLLDRFAQGLRDPEQKKSGSDQDHDYGVFQARLTRKGVRRVNSAIRDLMEVIKEEGASGRGRTYQVGYILTEVKDEEPS